MPCLDVLLFVTVQRSGTRKWLECNVIHIKLLLDQSSQQSSMGSCITRQDRMPLSVHVLVLHNILSHLRMVWFIPLPRLATIWYLIVSSINHTNWYFRPYHNISWWEDLPFFSLPERDRIFWHHSMNQRFVSETQDCCFYSSIQTKQTIFFVWKSFSIRTTSSLFGLCPIGWWRVFSDLQFVR